MVSFWTETNRKARKQHRCDWCGALISKGTNYNYQSGMTSEGFNSLKFHLYCKDELDHTISEEGHREEFCIGEMKDVFDEYYAQTYYKKLKKEEYDDETSSGGRD